MAPAKAETYYPLGNRQSRHPRPSRALSRRARPSSISHRYRPPTDVSESRSPRPVNLPDRSTSDRPDPHPGNPDRARCVPIGRSRARTFAETFICDDDRKNKNTTHFSIVSLSARRTLTRVPARSTFERMSEPRAIDRSRPHRIASSRASSSRARLHDDEDTKRNTRHRARSPSPSALVHARAHAP